MGCMCRRRGRRSWSVRWLSTAEPVAGRPGWFVGGRGGVGRGQAAAGGARILAWRTGLRPSILYGSRVRPMDYLLSCAPCVLYDAAGREIGVLVHDPTTGTRRRVMKGEGT